MTLIGSAPSIRPTPRFDQNNFPVPAPIVVREVPKSMWVAVCVFTKAVAVRRNQIATQPLTGGRMGIFNNVAPVSVEEQFGAEILAITLTREEADGTVEAHKAAHPDLGGEYHVSEHPVGVPAAADVPTGVVPTTHPCIDCHGGQLPADVARCPQCQERYWQSCGWRPASRDET